MIERERTGRREIERERGGWIYIIYIIERERGGGGAARVRQSERADESEKK